MISCAMKQTPHAKATRSPSSLWISSSNAFDGKRSLKDAAHDMTNALRKAGAKRLRQVRICQELAAALGLPDAADPYFPRYGRRIRPWALIDTEKWLAASEAAIRAELESSIPRPEALSPDCDLNGSVTSR